MQKEKLTNLLNELKQYHNIYGVKAEFETEENSFEELLYLREVTSKINLNFTIKIGGSGSLKDICEVKKLNADTILAPMIESKYALKKYVDTVKLVYSEDELKNIQLLINIETIDGFNNLNKIVKDENFKYIAGIVLGRNDLVSSMGLRKECVNSNEILNIANTIAKEMEEQNKILIIGGCIDTNSIDFFDKISSKSFKKFETRKIIFNLSDSLDKKSIYKAIEFEKLWLENKNEVSIVDKKRIEHLEEIFVK